MPLVHAASIRLSLRHRPCARSLKPLLERRLISEGLVLYRRTRELPPDGAGSFSKLQGGWRQSNLDCLLSASLLRYNSKCERHWLRPYDWPAASMGPFCTTHILRRSFQLTILCGVLLSNVRAHATTAGVSDSLAAGEGDTCLGDRELQTTCARDLIAILSGGVEAEAVAPPRAKALRSCLRPLISRDPGGALQKNLVSDASGAPFPALGELAGAVVRPASSNISTSEDSLGVDLQTSSDSRGEGTKKKTGLDDTTSSHSEFFDVFSFRNLVDVVSEAQLKKRGGERTLRGRRLRRENPAGLAERFGALIARPPPEVMALVRAVDAERGNGSALQRALGPGHFKFPDCEGSTEAHCQLARAPTGQRFSKQVVSRYFALLFEAVAAAAPAAGMPIALSRFDLFHGHFFYARDSRRFGIL